MLQEQHDQKDQVEGDEFEEEPVYIEEEYEEEDAEGQNIMTDPNKNYFETEDPLTQSMPAGMIGSGLSA